MALLSNYSVFLYFTYSSWFLALLLLHDMSVLMYASMLPKLENQLLSLLG
uniref:Uncharacterized protein n=1 Tax=Arundo donax TaxID=35708 RepID=A0A0A8YZB0_ARUDO